MLSAAMSRRARPGGEAGGPRRSKLGCRRRARRRTALLEMGVPPIEQHGGGGWRVGKRKIRPVVGFSEVRGKRPRLHCVSEIRAPIKKSATRTPAYINETKTTTSFFCQLWQNEKMF